jgi:plastocyanin
MWRWGIFFSLASAACAGSVSGRVELANSKDAAVRKHKDYAGVVVWLQPLGRAAPSARPRKVEMLQKDKRFTPHVVAIGVGSTVTFPNADPLFHNAFSNFDGQAFDVGLYPPGTTRSVTFIRPGIVRVFCNIHSTMSAIIAVLPSPWYAVTNGPGAYAIPNVPAGEYRVRIVHERALPEVLKSLEQRITVPAGGLALPPISVSEAGFIPAPHMNKYGREYPPVPDDSVYPGGGK